MSLCEVIKVRNLADRLGYPCTMTASHQCWDCGIAICEGHAETCSICREVFCGSCFSFHNVRHRKRATAAHKERQERKSA